MKIIRNAKGMTLPEMLLAVMIMAFIGAAIFSVLVQGIRIASAAFKSKAYTDYDFLVEKITTDLDNVLSYTAKPFSGSADSMEFYASASPKSSDFTTPVDALTPAKLKYTFEPYKNIVIRSEDGFQKILNPGAARASNESVVGEVKGCSFEYFYYDDKAKDYRWSSNWSESCLPYAVKVKLNIAEKGFSPNRVIVLPGGGNCGA